MLDGKKELRLYSAQGVRNGDTVSLHDIGVATMRIKSHRPDLFD